MRALFMLLTIVALAAIPAAANAQQAAPAVKGGAPAKSAKAASGATAIVNINTATQAQLESLPGVGAKAAERILEYRQKNGQFKKIEDLMNVKGIGEKSFLKLKPWLTVTDKAAPSGGSDRQV
jgi:competence protein ComEA